jgi:hypothetical protein
MMLIVGLHLAPATRHSALVVARRHEHLEGPFDPKRKRWPSVVSYSIPHIERFARGARLSEAIEAAASLLSGLPERSRLIVDQTAGGRPAVALMDAQHLGPTAVVIAESGRPHIAHRVLNIPRSDLVTTLALVMGEKRLTIGQILPDAETLLRQLTDYRVKPEADDPVDLAVACALAVWWGEVMVRSQVKQPPVPRQSIELDPPLTFDRAMKIARGERVTRTRI